MNQPVNQRRARASRRSSETRELLLEAARRCVREKGIAGATSREITASAGANLAAITYYFGSKDDLIAEALFGELERRVQPALRVLDGEGAPAERMLVAVQQLIEELQRSRKDIVVYLEALLLATRDAQYRRRARALYRGIAGRLAALIEELQAQGTIPPWVEAKAMASLILAAANGIVLQLQLDPTGPDQHELSAQFASLLLSSAGLPATDPG